MIKNIYFLKNRPETNSEMQELKAILLNESFWLTNLKTEK